MAGGAAPAHQASLATTHGILEAAALAHLRKMASEHQQIPNTQPQSPLKHLNL